MTQAKPVIRRLTATLVTTFAAIAALAMVLDFSTRSLIL